MRWILLILLLLVVTQVAVMLVAAGWAVVLYWIAPDLGVGPAYLAGLISTIITLYLFIGSVKAMGFRPYPAVVQHKGEDDEYEDDGDNDDGDVDEDDDDDIALTADEADELVRRLYLDLTPAMRRKLRARRN